MNKIAILTSGGDAPGMNACIRAAVRYAIYNEMTIYGINRGYNGLINKELTLMDRRSVSDIIDRGGTILRTARCPEFNTLDGQKKAAEVLRSFGIEGLLVLGGDGSLRGARDLTENFGVPTVGVPCTIDNDLGYTDFTIGFDTAVNTALNAINNLRDTMSSHERVCIIEVMGRECGDIALMAGLGGGAEVILIPEIGFDVDKVVGTLERGVKGGKTSGIIVLAEGVGKADDIGAQIKAKTKISIRTTVLGHIQRGGSPTYADRVLAAKLGVKAVEVLKKMKSGCKAVGIKKNAIFEAELNGALSEKRELDEYVYNVAQVLSL